MYLSSVNKYIRVGVILFHNYCSIFDIAMVKVIWLPIAVLIFRWASGGLLAIFMRFSGSFDRMSAPGIRIKRHSRNLRGLFIIINIE